MLNSSIIGLEVEVFDYIRGLRLVPLSLKIYVTQDKSVIQTISLQSHIVWNKSPTDPIIAIRNYLWQYMPENLS